MTKSHNLFTLILISLLIMMVGICVVATGEKALWESTSIMWNEMWFRATLLDLYIGLVLAVAYIWVFEKNWLIRILWMFGCFLLGNIATLIYLLYRIFTGKPLLSINK